MLELLNSNRKYTVRELADILEVSERMVRVYKEDLEKAGIFIDSIRGPYGGYVLNQSIKLPQRKFSNKDYLLLKKISKIKIDKDLKEQLEILSDKIRGVYQGSNQEKKELTGPTLSKYNVLNRAINEKRKVKILYYSYNKGENERVIRPYDLFLFKDGWGCAAFCEIKNDLRHFELKRIRSFKLLDETF